MAASPQFTDDTIIGRGTPEDLSKKQMLTTESWQVVSIPQNAKPTKTGGSYIGLTRNKRATLALNYYQPGMRDEMHCHPGSEHIFLCWQGELTIRGINEGEEIKLKPGELVHIKPVKPTPISRRSFRRAGDIKAENLLPAARMHGAS
jgi:quercetin dioxygenase-like cupin family protein